MAKPGRTGALTIMAQHTSAFNTRRGKSPANRSLERGIEILRAFRPGAEALGNGELAERTGLSRATVSRLTQTLVGTGFLQHDAALRAYRLGAPLLSLAHSMRSGSALLQAAAPLMRAAAQAQHCNVGLAVADRDEMVYLEAVRHKREPSLRSVVAGQRVPIALTSLGRAWLAAAPEAERQAMLAHLARRRAGKWRALARDIDAAIASVHTLGYCWASWQPEVVALSAPIVLARHPVYVLNMSVNTKAAPAVVARRLKAPLLRLAAQIGVLLARPS
jgi:DNA-binding IclR family transcriptional regulator